MGVVSISNSGTAWLRDMAAQGKSATGGWANSPNADYYASLDSANAPASVPSSTSAKALPSSLEELIKMQQAAAKQKEEDEKLAEELRKQIDKVASDGVPMTGNIVNTKA